MNNNSQVTITLNGINTNVGKIIKITGFKVQPGILDTQTTTGFDITSRYTLMAILPNSAYKNSPSNLLPIQKGLTYHLYEIAEFCNNNDFVGWIQDNTDKTSYEFSSSILLQVSNSSLSFTDTLVKTTSDVQYFDVTIVKKVLVGNARISGVPGFIISTNGGTIDQTPISLSGSQRIYVRLNPGQARQYSGVIEVSMTGVTTKTISISGSGVAIPINSVQHLKQIVGNEMLDISGNGYHVDIIGKDFDSNEGIPYKTAAMIAQKVGNFGLIPDPTNFWFTGGVPNQIPVVSFFQNIDYGNQIFNKHQPQILDTTGVEVFEPKVSDIVTFASVLTAGNLTNANTYFGVPAESTPSLYVPTGYATNTLALAAAANGNTIYNRSGVKTEVSNVTVNKSGSIRGIGFSVNDYGGAPSSLFFVSLLTTLERLIISGKNTVNIGLRLFVDGVTLNKLKVLAIGNSGSFIQETGNNAIVSDCVFINGNGTQYFTRSAPGIQIRGCFFSGVYPSGIFGNNAGAAETQSVLYCKIITTLGLTTSATFLVFNCNYNTFIITNMDRLIRHQAANGVLNFKYNNVRGIGTTQANAAVVAGSDVQLTSNLNVEYNFWRTDDNIGCFILAPLSNASVVRGNNVRLLSCFTEFIRINTSLLFEENLLVTIGNSPDANITNISVSSQTGQTTKDVKIQKNAIFNPKYYNSSLGGFHNCIYVRDYLDTVVRYNFVAGSGLYGIIMKSTTAMDNTENPVTYNISYLCGILAKGLGFVKFYNNTVIDAVAVGGIVMTVADDLTDLKTTYAKNNIVVTTVNNLPLVDIQSEIAQYPHQVNYNVYFSNYAKPFKYKGVEKTWEEWRGLGYDANSIMLTSAQFANLFVDYANRDFRTKTDYLIGENLGSNYNMGLDKTSTFGDQVIPKVVLKQQPRNWSVGAYIQ